MALHINNNNNSNNSNNNLVSQSTSISNMKIFHNLHIHKLGVRMSESSLYELLTD